MTELWGAVIPEPIKPKPNINILYHVHGYPPIHNAGAEWMMHEINIRLIQAGFEPKVVCTSIGTESYEFEGVKVYGAGDAERTRQLWNEATIIITQLDA